MPRHAANRALATIPAGNDMSAVFVTEAINIGHCDAYSVQAAWVGTPVGNFTLEASDDEPGTSGDGIGTNVVNWTTVGGSTVAAGGAAGTAMWNYTGAGYRWVRVRYTWTSGGAAGNFTSARANTKGAG